MQKICRFSFLLCLTVIAVPAVHAKLDDSKVPFSIERLNQYPLIQGRSPAGAELSPDGSTLVFGWNRTGAKVLDVYTCDVKSGRIRRILLASAIGWLPQQDTPPEEAKDMIEERQKADVGIGQFTWAPDGKQIAFSYKGRVWLMDADGKNLHPLVDASLGIFQPKFSPDGKWIAFEMNANVYRIDRVTGEIKQLTFISKPKTRINEFTWSPDSQNLLVAWSDSSKVGSATMIDFTKGRGTAVTIQRDWNGDLSQNVKFGVVPVAGGLIKFIEGIPTSCWPSNPDWSPDSKKIAVGWFSDDFKQFSISLANWPTAKSTVIYNEKAPENYESDWRPVLWSKDSKNVIFGTDISDNKFIFRSVFEVNADSHQVSPVFVRNYAVGSVSRPKDSSHLILVTAGRSPLSTEVHILSGDGDKTIVPIENGYATASEFDSAAPPLMSDDGNVLVAPVGNRTTPNDLYTLFPQVKRLTNSPTSDFKKIPWANVTEVTFPGPEGATMHGLLFVPPNLDKSQLHPAVVSNIYGDSGKDHWGGFMENQLAMNHGMVVLALDFRASWGYGGAFDTGYYRKMGLIDADEAADAAKYLSSLPYVNKKRLGIWGWSYGGFLTLMTMLTKPGVYDTGVAVAPVTDWTTYNEWYTRRRLGLAKDDPEIYKKTSPISYASGLQGNLLICHGIVDNNVLFENTAVMMENFIRANKFVDLMIFPKDDHSISRESSRPYVMGRILNYLVTELTRP